MVSAAPAFSTAPGSSNAGDFVCVLPLLNKGTQLIGGEGSPKRPRSPQFRQSSRSPKTQRKSDQVARKVCLHAVAWLLSCSGHNTGRSRRVERCHALLVHSAVSVA